MFNKISTITALSTLVACSTPFEALDQDFAIEASIDAAQPGVVAQLDLSIDDQEGLELADVEAMALEIIDTDVPEVPAPVIDEDSNPVEGFESFVVEEPESASELSALLTKRVDNHLQIRLYPASNVSAKVCLHRPDGEVCFKGQTRRFDNDQGGELDVELGRYETARSFSISISEPGSESAELGPFEMPASDNIWTEQQGCESRARIEGLEHQVQHVGDEKIAYVAYHSIDPTSALLCGVDEAGDSTCVWEPVSDGNKLLKVRVGQTARDALIRDEKGCSILIRPSLY